MKKISLFAFCIALGCGNGATMVLESPGRNVPVAANGKIVIIAGSPTTSGVTGWPIGAWAAEVTHPYYEFVSAGYTVEFASPGGGEVEFDAWSLPTHESGYSSHDIITMGFLNSPEVMAGLKDTKKISSLKVEDYAAIFVAGGSSPMYTFKGNETLTKFVADFYETGKPTAIVCHGGVILLETRLSSGKLLVDGKSWTAFSNEEEKDVEKNVGQKMQPFWIETEAKKIKSTSFETKAAWSGHAIKDGNLITGQQQESGGLAARLVIDSLAK